MTRRVPILLCVALAGAALVAGTLAGLSLRSMPADTGDTSTAAAIAGDFELSTVAGRRVALSSLRGSVVALFFGYTHCPDICPATLFSASTVLLQGMHSSINGRSQWELAIYRSLCSDKVYVWNLITGCVSRACQAIACRLMSVLESQRSHDIRLSR